MEDIEQHTCDGCEFLGKRESKLIHPDVSDTSVEIYCKKNKTKIRGYVSWYKNKTILTPDWCHKIVEINEI